MTLESILITHEMRIIWEISYKRDNDFTYIFVAVKSWGMVGYDPQWDGLMPKYGHSVAGAASGMITRAITQPLDVLKVRFQVRKENKLTL